MAIRVPIMAIRVPIMAIRLPIMAIRVPLTGVIHGSFMRHLTGIRAAAAWPPIVRGATIDAPE
jgi:hypothetical protein